MPQILHIIIRKTDIEEYRVLTTNHIQPQKLYIHTHQKKKKKLYLYLHTHICGGPQKHKLPRCAINPSCYGLCGYTRTVLVLVFLKELPLASLRGRTTWAMNWTKSSNIIRFTDLLFPGMTLACFGLLKLKLN